MRPCSAISRKCKTGDESTARGFYGFDHQVGRVVARWRSVFSAPTPATGYFWLFGVDYLVDCSPQPVPTLAETVESCTEYALRGRHILAWQMSRGLGHPGDCDIYRRAKVLGLFCYPGPRWPEMSAIFADAGEPRSLAWITSNADHPPGWTHSPRYLSPRGAPRRAGHPSLCSRK